MLRFFIFLAPLFLSENERQPRRLQNTFNMPNSWYSTFGGLSDDADSCADSDIELQIVTNDATKTCQDAVRIVFSIGFDCDTPLAELEDHVLRDYCCQACPTFQPSKSPTRIGTCSDNNDLLKYKMGWFQAECETEVNRVIALGSSCSEQQIWNGRLEEVCCASCNGPGSTTDGTTEEPNVCSLFNTGSGQICNDIEFEDTMCRVLTNFHEYTQNCDSFCSDHGTNCIGAWTPLTGGTCHGGSWLARDCDYESDGHICDCQDASISLSPTTSKPTASPTSGPTTSPTSGPTPLPTPSPTVSPSIAPTATMPSASPTSQAELIRYLQETIRQQTAELKDLKSEWQDARDTCTQRFNQIEAKMQC